MRPRIELRLCMSLIYANALEARFYSAHRPVVLSRILRQEILIFKITGSGSDLMIPSMKWWPRIEFIAIVRETIGQSG